MFLYAKYRGNSIPHWRLYLLLSLSPPPFYRLRSTALLPLAIPLSRPCILWVVSLSESTFNATFAQTQSQLNFTPSTIVASFSSSIWQKEARFSILFSPETLCNASRADSSLFYFSRDYLPVGTLAHLTLRSSEYLFICSLREIVPSIKKTFYYYRCFFHICAGSIVRTEFIFSLTTGI